MTGGFVQEQPSSAPRPPTTEEVLRLIGKDGVVVGSFAEYGSSTKDVDVVVKENTSPEGPLSLVTKRVLQEYREFCESEAIGHLWVNSVPLPVELFATTAWRTGDPEKDANRILYRQAKRNCTRKTIMGVEMWVLTVKAEE
jgi:hypothetical protein